MLTIDRVETHHEDNVPNFEQSSDYARSLQRKYAEYAHSVIPECT